MAALIGLREGLDNPAFGVAVTLAFIVLLDAARLRRQVAQHASALNNLTRQEDPAAARLRERMGHTPLEIAAGVVVGILVALAINHFA